MRLSLEEGSLLVRMAREAILKHLRGEGYHLPDGIPDSLKQRAGAFVTLLVKLRGEWVLRGCMGIPQPDLPLAKSVVEAGINAATRDPRFEPVKEDELGSLRIEVSVLSPPVQLKARSPRDYPTLIKVGRDGLIVRRGPFAGLLLPQVAVEERWDEEEFLCQTCIKAGLPPDSWLLKDTEVFSFRAWVFAEKEPWGEVELRLACNE